MVDNNEVSMAQPGSEISALKLFVACGNSRNSTTGHRKGVSNMEQLKSGEREQLIMPGPKFGEKRGWWSRFVDWTKKNRSNLILAIIGVLIIAGGIYLYSNYQKSNNPAQSPSNEQTQNEQGIVKPEQVNITNQQQNSSQTGQSNQKAEVTKSENNTITVKADKGAGITHLAREATKKYLADNQDIAKNISAEHKIYIEDYITKKTGSYGLKVGQELTFDNNLIKEAIDHAQQLNQKQLQNLHKYVLLVPSLSS